MANDLVKQDINFLEYPVWFQDDRVEGKKDGFVWQDREGYIHRSYYKPPVKMDFVFLLFLLMKSQDAGWADKLDLTRYEIVKGCGLTPDKRWYDRLVDSLKRWELVRLEFAGTFYDGKRYKTFHFGVIDSWGIDEDSKRLKIRFSPEWLLKIKESSFFKLLDFQQVKTLRSPLNIRLYEILVKNFQGRSVWQIDSMKLAEKIPMAEKYPSDVVPKIRSSVNRITQVTDLHIDLSVEQERGKAMLTFTRLPQEDKSTVPPVEAPREDTALQELLGLIPPKHQAKQTIVDIVKSAMDKHGPDYVRRNILYTNSHSNGSYRGYLAKALAGDWGLAVVEDEATKAHERAIAQASAKTAALEAEAERHRLRAKELKVKETLKAMGDDDKALLRDRALKELPQALWRNEKSVQIIMASILDREME